MTENDKMTNNVKLRKLNGVEMKRLSEEEFKVSEKFPLMLLFQNIRSMWNVGAIFRVADAARVEKIFITGYTAVPPRKEIEKTALGATETVAWEYIHDAKVAITNLKKQGVKIAALEITENSRKYHELTQNDFPLCIVLGNEVSGVDDEVLELCDFALEIPQYGTKHSLNVAVAAGIAVFEAVRVLNLHQTKPYTQE
ncbi:MAG: RNA methyltransferase [Chloroherpetonaceae bacterium]|nr:RNA methyltransferase [Chloroherpetonaceae bacterium]